MESCKRGALIGRILLLMSLFQSVILFIVVIAKLFPTLTFLATHKILLLQSESSW
jgi:hypothetical protein